MISLLYLSDNYKLTDKVFKEQGLRKTL